MNRHIPSVHKEKEPYKCNNCDASFTTKQLLAKVNLLTYKGKKLYQCNHGIYDTIFAEKANMNDQASVHEGKKPQNVTFVKLALQIESWPCSIIS